jgi:hypothetical protein
MLLRPPRGAYFAQRLYQFHPSQFAGLITLNVAIMPPRSENFDLDQTNAWSEKTLGYPMYAYW